MTQKESPKENLAFNLHDPESPKENGVMETPCFKGHGGPAARQPPLPLLPGPELSAGVPMASSSGQAQPMGASVADLGGPSLVCEKETPFRNPRKPPKKKNEGGGWWKTRGLGMKTPLNQLEA